MHMKWIWAASALALATSAAAQDAAAPAAPAGAGQDNAVGDIVITARRRAESSMKVPVAVTAFNADSLRTKNINTQDDLVAHTPGLVSSSTNGQRSLGGFFIRGQGATYGSQPGVITYMNEVPAFTVSMLGNNAQFFDLGSVEVLKGPQGTLFGRSTTGGAVLLTSQRPTDSLGGTLELRYGNDNYVDVQGAVNLPIVKDKVLLRVAGDLVRRDGFTLNVPTGQRLDDKHRDAWRVSLLIKPVDGIDNLTIVSGQDIRENGGSVVLGEYNPAAAGTAALLYNPNSAVTASGTTVYPTRRTIAGVCAGLTGSASSQAYASCYNARLAASTTLYANLQSALANTDVRKTYMSQLLGVVGNTQNITNITNVHLDGIGALGDVTIKNIFATNRVGNAQSTKELSGFGGAEAVNGYTITGGSLVTSPYNRINFLDNFSDEFQVQGHSALLDWAVGYYYNFQKTPANQGSMFGTFGNILDSEFPNPSTVTNAKFDERQTDKGIYAQATVRPFAGASLTAGVRRSTYSDGWLNGPVTYDVATGNLGVGATTASDTLHQGATSYNFAADYKPMDGMLVYATTRRGFKPGGLNSVPAVTPLPTSFVASYAPETLTDYEMGIKYAWRGPIAGRVTLDGFTSNYSNIQRSSPYPAAGSLVYTQTANIAAGRIRGAEFESELRFGPRLTAGLNAAYTDARYTNWVNGLGSATTTSEPFPNGATGITIANVDIPFSNTPRFTWSINARYALIDRPDFGQVAVSGNYYHQSFAVVDDNYASDPLRLGGQSGYGLLNLRIDWLNVAGKAFDLFVNASNVADKTYKVGSSDLLTSGLGTVGLIYGEPRMVSGGIRIHY